MPLWALAQFHFDNTVTLGNLISGVCFLFLGGMAWADLRWRVSNLETWRKEHILDAESRDQLISSIAEIAKKLEWLESERQRINNNPFGKRRIHD